MRYSVCIPVCIYLCMYIDISRFTYYLLIIVINRRSPTTTSVVFSSIWQSFLLMLFSSNMSSIYVYYLSSPIKYIDIKYIDVFSTSWLLFFFFNLRIINFNLDIRGVLSVHMRVYIRVHYFCRISNYTSENYYFCLYFFITFLFFFF